MGKALSPHLGTEFWFRRWPWWYFYISRLCFANWNADMCRNSLIVILCFCNIILGLADLFFFSFFHCQHCFSSELYYPLTSEEAKLHMSAWQESSTDSKFVTSCVFLLFPPWVMKCPPFRERYCGMGSPLMVTMLCLMELLLLQSWREGTGDLQVNPFLWVVGTYPQRWLPVSMGNGGLTGLKVIASFILIKFNGLCNERPQLME